MGKNQDFAAIVMALGGIIVAIATIWSIDKNTVSECMKVLATSLLAIFLLYIYITINFVKKQERRKAERK